MMREVLTRRFARLVKEEARRSPNAKWRRPDLVLIDGGPGQLSIACQVFADLGVEDVALVGISKGPDRDAGREHFYMPGKEPFRLDPKSPVLYYLQRLRDEAHRFAIGSHRKKRSAGHRRQSAGRDRRRRRRPQTRAAAAFRLGPGGGGGQPDRSGVGGGRQRDTGQENLRLLPSGRVTVQRDGTASKLAPCSPCPTP